MFTVTTIISLKKEDKDQKNQSFPREEFSNQSRFLYEVKDMDDLDMKKWHNANNMN